MIARMIELWSQHKSRGWSITQSQGNVWHDNSNDMENLNPPLKGSLSLRNPRIERSLSLFPSSSPPTSPSLSPESLLKRHLPPLRRSLQRLPRFISQFPSPRHQKPKNQIRTLALEAPFSPFLLPLSPNLTLKKNPRPPLANQDHQILLKHLKFAQTAWLSPHLFSLPKDITLETTIWRCRNFRPWENRERKEGGWEGTSGEYVCIAYDVLNLFFFVSVGTDCGWIPLIREH